MLIGWGTTVHAGCPTTAVDLLVGHWRGRESDEHWTPVGATIVGVSLSRQFWELLLLERSPGVAYVARPVGGAAVRFPCTDASEGVVAFGEPAHDWPKSLRYTRSERGLRAVVGVGDRGDLDLRWRAFAPEAWAVPSTFGVDADARLWWGETTLGSDRVPEVRWELATTARASKGELVMASGTASLDGASAPFGAVWRVDGPDVVLVGFAAWPPTEPSRFE